MFEKIKSKLLIFIVPTIIIIVIFNYLFSINVANSIISSEIDKKLISIRNTKNVKVDKTLEEIAITTKDLATVTEQTYTKASEETYEIILKSMLRDNSNMLGIGLWFEPNVYNKDNKFVSIYAINKDGDIVIDDYYETENYDYFNMPFYEDTIKNGKIIFTDPFYDKQSDKYILTCATPMFDTYGNSIGVVTADIDLSYLPEIIDNYNTEDNKLYIVNDDGVFIAHDDFSFVKESKNILELENEEIAELGRLSLSTEEGISSFNENGKKFRVYYSTIDELGWKLMFVVSEESIDAPLKKINFYFMLFGIFVILTSVTILTLIVRKNIDKPINVLVDEIELIAKNNFDSPISQEIFKQNNEFSKVGKTLGSMKAQIKKYQEELELSSRVNRQNAIELERKNNELENKIKVIEYLSFHDQLTGLNNRRLFEQQLNEFNDSNCFPVHVIVAHVNSLKIINDSFGHEVGDKLLLEYVNVLKSTSIDLKYVSRTSGNEFAILIPSTPSEVVENFLADLSAKCKNREINGLTLSVSFGLATLKENHKSIYEILRDAEESMNHNKLYDEPGRRDKTIKIINSTLQEKNPREQLHSERVAKYCEDIAREIGLSSSQQEIISNAGLLHDIGKIGIPEELLNNPGKLTAEEFNVISKHPEIGYRILSSAGDMNDISEMVLAHHERCDGTGYPKNLKCDEIPLGAKIIAVADSFDAMTSDRSYRKGLPVEIAIEELVSCGGTQFDAEIVDIFVNKVLPNYL